jgi:hypothetical protein
MIDELVNIFFLCCAGFVVMGGLVLLVLATGLGGPT